MSYSCDERGYINFVEGLIIMKRYKMLSQIGKGTFSRVMRCLDMQKSETDENRFVALKINRNVDKYKAAAKIEYQILNAIRNIDTKGVSNCAHLLSTFDYYGHYCFVFPLFGRSVYRVLSINKYTPFITKQVQQFAWQIIGAVKFMHDCKIIFTDLKPENLVFIRNKTTFIQISKLEQYLPYAFKFWKERMYKAGYSNSSIMALEVEVPTDPGIKVIDFGSALFESQWHSHLVQTRHYRAPEVVLGMRWSFPIDIWSIGCILLEFIYGRMVFNTHDAIDHLNQMTTMIGPMPKKLLKIIPSEVYRTYFIKDRELRLQNAKISAVQCQNLKKYFKPNSRDLLLDLVSRMLRWMPEERISCEEALNHPYFKDVDTTKLHPKKHVEEEKGHIIV